MDPEKVIFLERHMTKCKGTIQAAEATLSPSLTLSNSRGKRAGGRGVPSWIEAAGACETKQARGGDVLDKLWDILSLPLAFKEKRAGIPTEEAEAPFPSLRPGDY